MSPLPRRPSVSFTQQQDRPTSPECVTNRARRPSLAERVTSRAEDDLERYGGDDIREPAPKRGLESEESEADEETIQEEVPQGRTEGPVQWDGPDDPHNPQNWSTRYKVLVTFLCILLTLNVTFASAAPSTTETAVIREFGISHEVAYLTTTVFLLGYVFGPFFWAPGSELVGRRPIFIITMTSYTLFIMGQALAKNVQTFLVTRFLSGFFAVAPLTNCGGVIADIWGPVGRGYASCLFGASVFLGPVLGPIVAGYITQSGTSWRWVFWVMMIFAGTCTASAVILLPETYAPILLTKKAKKLRKEDPVMNKEVYAEHEKQDWEFKALIHRTLFRPFTMLVMEPILLLVTVYLSIVYGLLYALFQAIPIIFLVRRGFTIGEVGLMFIGVGIGTTLGALMLIVVGRDYGHLNVKWRGFPPPEYRLRAAMYGSPLLVVACFWMGWTGEYSSVPWYVPGLSTILLGLGISSIFMSFLSYLVDTYLMYSASALAANTIVRSAVAAAFPLFTVQMFTNLGVNWACTLLGLIALVFAISPFLFFKYGARIRAKSRFAPCIDLKIAKDIEREANEKAENV